MRVTMLLASIDRFDPGSTCPGSVARRVRDVHRSCICVFGIRFENSSKQVQTADNDIIDIVVSYAIVTDSRLVGISRTQSATGSVQTAHLSNSKLEEQSYNDNVMSCSEEVQNKWGCRLCWCKVDSSIQEQEERTCYSRIIQPYSTAAPSSRHIFHKSPDRCGCRTSNKKGNKILEILIFIYKQI